MGKVTSQIAFYILALANICLADTIDGKVRVQCADYSNQFIGGIHKPFQVECKIKNNSSNYVFIKNFESSSCKIKETKSEQAPIAPNGVEITVELDCVANDYGFFSKDLRFQFQDNKKNSFDKKQLISGNVPKHEGCGDVRLDQPGGSFYGVASLEQKMPNCQTHSALDLYDAWRFSHGSSDKRQSSPGYTFLEMCSKNEISFNEDYIAGRVLETLMKREPCALTSGSKNQSEIYTENVEKFAFSVDSLIQSGIKNDDQSPSQLLENITSCASRESVVLDKKLINLLSTTVTSLQDYSDISTYVKTSCDSKDRIKKPPPFSIKGARDIYPQEKLHVFSGPPVKWQRDHMEEVNRCLDQKTSSCQPISVAFCSVILQQEYIKHKNESLECDGHMATIIGRRFNERKNRCEVLLRNASTLSDKKENELWEREGKTNDLWVDQTSLTSASANYVQLEDPK